MLMVPADAKKYLQIAQYNSRIYRLFVCDTAVNVHIPPCTTHIVHHFFDNKIASQPAAEFGDPGPDFRKNLMTNL